MEGIKIVKGGLLICLDENKTSGYYDIVIKNDLISEIIPSSEFNFQQINERYPDAEIINAKGKLIVPGFINTNLNSSFALSKLFLRNTYYGTINSIIALKRLEKYFTNINSEHDLNQLMVFAYSEMLMSGVTSLADISNYIYRDFIKKYFTENEIIKQQIIFTSYHFSLSTIFKYQRRFYLTGFKFDDEINNYSINLLQKNYHPGENKLYFDIFNRENYNEQTKKVFGKSLLRVFRDFNLLSEDTIISNPVNIHIDDMKLFGENNVNVVFNPSDFIKLSTKNIEFEQIINSGANVSIGTGYYGRDLLSECRSFSKLIYKSKFSYSEILKMITVNAAKTLCLENKGSIKRNFKADLIFFNMSDIRNIAGVPELSEEYLSEYLIESFSAKDVQEVMINGDIEYSAGSVKGLNLENLYFNTRELIRKIYTVSNYAELKGQHYNRKTTSSALNNVIDSSKFRNEIHGNYTEFDNSSDEFVIVGKKDMEIFNTIIESDRNNDEFIKFIKQIESFKEGFVSFVKKRRTP